MTENNPYSPPASVSLPIADQADGFKVQNAIVFYAVCFSVGASLGFLGRLVRPFITGRIHFEALIELALKLAISLVLIGLTSNRRADRHALRFTFSVLAFWVGSAIGWTILNGGPRADHLLVNASSCLIMVTLGLTWIGLISRGTRMP